MRLFTAIDIPTAVKRNLEALLGRLRPTARLKWSPPGNLHITTKFVGEWPEERLEDLKAALAAVPSREALEISVQGLGWFPNPHSPRVFWAAVKAPPALAHLAKETDTALVRIGVPSETKPFSPHLTLARIKEPVPLAAMRQAIAGLESDDFGLFTADRFYLYLSEMRPSGSVYTRLAEFPFRP
jgi:RNA 2',3'-cyclic 3'-phosphodiesterase